MAAFGTPAGGPPRYDCAETEEQLGVLLLGRLNGRERQRVEAHVRICPGCRAAHDYIAVVPSYLDLLGGDV